MKPLGPQTTILNTYRFCRLLCPRGKFFRYKFFRLHSDKFCQGDFFSKNSMEEPLFKREKKKHLLFPHPWTFYVTFCYGSIWRTKAAQRNSGGHWLFLELSHPLQSVFPTCSRQQWIWEKTSRPSADSMPSQDHNSCTQLGI